MADRTQPRLELPSACLHAPTHREPHVDSEEAMQYERQRVSRELEPVSNGESSLQSLEVAQTSPADPSYANTRSRNASLRHSITSPESLQHFHSAANSTGTQPDITGATESSVGNSRMSIRALHWHDPITKFWKTHVSLTIEEGSHRDHLGMQF
jgi:hypothetical protein